MFALKRYSLPLPTSTVKRFATGSRMSTMELSPPAAAAESPPINEVFAAAREARGGLMNGFGYTNGR